MKYEELLAAAEAKGLVVREKPLYGYNGLTYGKRIAIRSDMTEAEKKCVLAEEMAHAELTVGDITDLSAADNRKQEHLSRLKAYNSVIGLMGLVNAYKAGCRSRHEIADYLDVSEEFLNDAIEVYRQKYGCHVRVDNYVVYFIPAIGVLEIV